MLFFFFFAFSQVQSSFILIGAGITAISVVEIRIPYLLNSDPSVSGIRIRPPAASIQLQREETKGRFLGE